MSPQPWLRAPLGGGHQDPGVSQYEAHHQKEPAKIVVAVHLTREVGLIVRHPSGWVGVDQVYDGEVEKQVGWEEDRLQRNAQDSLLVLRREKVVSVVLRGRVKALGQPTKPAKHTSM